MKINALRLLVSAHIVALAIVGCAAPDNHAASNPTPEVSQPASPEDEPEVVEKDPGTDAADNSARAEESGEPKFQTYDEAMDYVRRAYDGEQIDTSRSSWITGAEYFEADGHGYLILGMNGKDYIFEGLPPDVWEEFKAARSLGGYYNARIRGRYGFRLGRR